MQRFQQLLEQVTGASSQNLTHSRVAVAEIMKVPVPGTHRVPSAPEQPCGTWSSPGINSTAGAGARHSQGAGQVSQAPAQGASSSPRAGRGCCWMRKHRKERLMPVSVGVPDPRGNGCELWNVRDVW